MPLVKTVLYIHGMGGGASSRIPAILSETLPEGIRVVVRTYDFNPETGRKQILSWMDELHPDLVIGESLGAIQAIRVRGVPHILVSPSLGAPARMYALGFLTLIPGMSWLCGKIWKPRDGERQQLRFNFATLKLYKPHFKDALKNTPAAGSTDYFFAFFGTRDHYRRNGVVSVRLWKKYFGDGHHQFYEGTHFMEEEYVRTILIYKIISVLK